MIDELENRIRLAQIHAGEEVVLDHLRKRGLLDGQTTVIPIAKAELQEISTAGRIASLEAEIARLRTERDTWQPTHEHYKGGLYRVIGRGLIEADRSPVVIYDNAMGEIWVRPESDFDQTDPFVRFAPIRRYSK